MFSAYAPRIVRSGCRLCCLVSIGWLGGCPSTPAQRFNPDVFVADTGPRDANVDALDAGTDTGTDASVPPGDGGLGATCLAGTPETLFTTAYRPGGIVPFNAAANVGGLLVAATIQTEANYPFYERVVGFLDATGGTSGPLLVFGSTMAPSVTIGVAPQGIGYLTLFADTVALGTASQDLWTRSVLGNGAPVGTDATALTSTASAESRPELLATSTGYVAAWLDSVSGWTTAVLDATGAVVGSTHSAASVVGASSFVRLFSTGTTNFLAYFGADARVHTVPLQADGTVSASAATVSMQDGMGDFDIAGAPSAAGLAYTAAGPAVRFRALAANGTSIVVERTLHGVDEHGTSPSVVALGGGYLVLFRFVPLSGNATLRLAFVTTSGDLLSSVDLVDNFPNGPRAMIRISSDAEIYVVFQEAAVLNSGGSPFNGAAVRAMRVVCE